MGDIRKVYKFKEVLGGGHFGTVRIGFQREMQNKTYAIKSISKKHLSQKDIDELTKEVDIISTLDHPNIIKFHETYQDKTYFHIVMELCSGKDLFEKYIVAIWSSLQEDTINLSDNAFVAFAPTPFIPQSYFIH